MSYLVETARRAVRGAPGGHALPDSFRRPLRQVQNERLQTAQIKFQRRILFGFRATRLLKFGIRFRPALFSIQNYPAPERVTLRDAFWSGLRRKPKGLVNSKPIV